MSGLTKTQAEELLDWAEAHGYTFREVTSPDGVTWNKRGRILSPEGWEGTYIAANGTALEFNGEIFYWYQAGDPVRIALAKSSDGFTWLRARSPDGVEGWIVSTAVTG